MTEKNPFFSQPRYNRLPPKLPTKEANTFPSAPAHTLTGDQAVARVQEAGGSTEKAERLAQGASEGTVVDVIKDHDKRELLLVTAVEMDNGAREDFDDLFPLGKHKTPQGPNVEVLAIPIPEGFTLDTFDYVLSAAELVWRTGGTGVAPEARKVAQISGVPLDITREVMTTEAYKVGCKARGITPGEMPGLSPRQVTALQILMDPTAGVSLDRRLKKAGVSVREYNAWKKNTAFAAEMQKMKNVLTDYEDDILVSLAGAAVAGDLPAMKFALEVSGRHNPQDQNSMAVREVIGVVLEILQTEITDTAILAKIGVRMQGLAISSGAFAHTNNPKEIEG